MLYAMGAASVSVVDLLGVDGGRRPRLLLDDLLLLLRDRLGPQDIPLLLS